MDKLNADDILRAEYDYIAQTIFQANEDRSRATSFYLLTFSSFIAAIVSYQLDLGVEVTWVDWGFAALFFTLATMGVLTVLQLVRLRMAWYESVQAMNQIKDYYLARHADLEQAFAWRSGTARKFKWNSVGFLLVAQVAILGGAALGASVFFALRALVGSSWLLPSFLAGFFFLLWQVDVYRSALK